MATPVVRESLFDDAPNVTGTVTFGSGSKAGDILVVFAAADWLGIADVQTPVATSVANGASVATFTNRYLGNNTTTNTLHAKCFTAQLTADGAFTVNWAVASSQDGAMAAVLVDGSTVDSTNWLDAISVTPQAQQTAGTGHIIPTCSPSGPDDLWLGFVATNINVAYTGPAGTTKLGGVASRTYCSVAAFSRNLITTGATGTTTITSSQNRLYQSFAITIRAKTRVPTSWKGDYTKNDVVAAGYGDYNWNRQTAAGDGNASGIPWPIVLDTAPPGRPGKAVPFYLPVNSKRNEVEPHPAQQFKAGDDYYFGFSFWLGPTVNLHGGNYQVIDQQRQANSQGSPPVGFEILRSELRMTGGYGIDGTTPARLSYSVTLKTGIVTQQWYDLVYRIRNYSASESTSLIDVWVDGVQILNGYTILPPTIIGGDTYHKQGWYRDPANSAGNGGSPEGTVWHVRSAMGSSYDAVDPAYLATTEDAFWRRTIAELNGFASWCAAGRARGYVGEFGNVAIQDRYGNYTEQSKWNGHLYNYLSRLNALGFDATMWASGREFDPGYPLAVQVGNAQNAPLTLNTAAGVTLDYFPSTPSYLRGVNLSGGETGIAVNGGGTVRTDLGYYHTQGDYQFLAASGVDTIRLNGAWERAQPTLMGALDTAWLAEMANEIAYAYQYGIKIILDPLHNYARYTLADGTVYAMVFRGSNLNSYHIQDFWTKLANWVNADPIRSQVVVGYCIMNEPHDLAAATGPPALTGAQVWETIAQETLNAIRATGDQHMIYIPGYNYSSLIKWQQSHPVPWIVDPLNKFAYEAHHYPDSTSYFGANSGTFQQSATGPITTYAQELAAAVTWEAGAGGESVVAQPLTTYPVVANPATDSRAGIVVSDDFQSMAKFGTGLLWNTVTNPAGDPAMSIVGERLRIPAVPGPKYQGIKTDYTETILNKVFGVEYCTAPAVLASTALEARILMDAPAGTVAAGTRLAITQKPITNTIEFRSEVNYYDATPVSITFDPVAHRWWRFYSDGTNMLFQTSPDGLTWTTRRTLALATWMNAATLRFTIETARTGGSTTDYAEFDNVNTYPVVQNVFNVDAFFGIAAMRIG